MPLREDEHEDKQANDEDGSADDSELVEVLLDRARTAHVGVHGTGNHLRNTRALAGMHKNEDDKADARKEPDNNQRDKQRVQDALLIVRTKGLNVKTAGKASNEGSVESLEPNRGTPRAETIDNCIRKPCVG